MAIDNLSFLQATSRSAGLQYPANYGEYSGQSYEKSAITPQNSINTVNPYGYTTEDLELANAIAENDYKIGSSYPLTTQGTSTTSAYQGSSFEGFSIPEFNGTGELIPDVSDRENSIEGCNWLPYMA